MTLTKPVPWVILGVMRSSSALIWNTLFVTVQLLGHAARDAMGLVRQRTVEDGDNRNIRGRESCRHPNDSCSSKKVSFNANFCTGHIVECVTSVDSALV